MVRRCLVEVISCHWAAGGLQPEGGSDWTVMRWRPRHELAMATTGRLVSFEHRQVEADSTVAWI
jgi:hypothetical protein